MRGLPIHGCIYNTTKPENYDHELTEVISAPILKIPNCKDAKLF